MLRLSTPGYLRFSQARQFDATFGGGEANVAVSLANYGVDAHFVTRLPKNDIADMHNPSSGSKNKGLRIQIHPSAIAGRIFFCYFCTPYSFKHSTL